MFSLIFQLQTKVNATQCAGTMFARLAAVFQSLGGPSIIDELEHALTKRPVLVIGGLTLSGRSAVANCAHEAYGGTLQSANSLINSLAVKRRISVTQFVSLLRTDSAVEAEVDLQLCRLVCSGSVNSPLIIEGRMAGFLAAFMRFLGKKNIMSVFVSCTQTGASTAVFASAVWRACVFCVSGETAACCRGYAQPGGRAIYQAERVPAEL